MGNSPGLISCGINSGLISCGISSGLIPYSNNLSKLVACGITMGLRSMRSSYEAHIMYYQVITILHTKHVLFKFRNKECATCYTDGHSLRGLRILADLGPRATTTIFFLKL